MTKTTYVATAPDGSSHTRKTDRNYTHAVLLEGEEEWKLVGFCSRLDLAEKKHGEHPGSIMVECGILGDRAADMPQAATIENIEMAEAGTDREKTVDQKIREPKVRVPAGVELKRTIGSLVQELLMDPDLGYEAIVDRVVAEFPDAKTSVRSVASVATVLRRKGAEVPMRRKIKAP